MLTLSKVPRPQITVGPTVEPITLAEAKKQCEIAASDSFHDAQLAGFIEAARQQWESDTGEHYIQQTWEIKLPYLCEFSFPHRPVSSITSIQYFDSGNTTQTLATSVYELDVARSALRLKYLQYWPTTSDRWDASTVTYVLGNHSSSSTVPAIAKSAMLLLVGYYWLKNRGDYDSLNDLRSYELLVAKNMRSSYP